MNPIHYTIFRKPTDRIEVRCPEPGIYKSSVDQFSMFQSNITCPYDSPIILTNGCENKNQSQITLSSSCRHSDLTQVQIITMMHGICLSSWKIDRHVRRTLIVDDTNKTFCLVCNSFNIFRVY